MRDSATNNEKASRKERNDLLVGLLKDHYSGMIDFEFKHGTFLVIVLGWFIISL